MLGAPLSLPGTDDLRAAYLALQLLYEWSDAEHASRKAMEESLRAWVRTARDSRMPAPVRAAAGTASRRREYVLNAWERGRTNAVAEALNRRIKDVIRDSRGFGSFDALRRRCLLALGSPREQAGSIPLFERQGGRGEGAAG